MGIPSIGLNAYVTWKTKGWLKPQGAILDLGAQQLSDEIEPLYLNSFITAFGVAPYAEGEMPKSGDFAGHVFGRAGFRYSSIDILPLPFAIPLDLNRSPLPAAHLGRYDLVANHGTSEHILNQWNVFKVVHDAAKPGGLMFHAVPMACDFEHGLVSYNPKFFWGLAETNGYEILSFRGWTGDEMVLPDSFLTQIKFKEKLPNGFKLNVPRGVLSWIFVLFRKTDKRPFAGLIDPAFK